MRRLLVAALVGLGLAAADRPAPAAEDAAPPAQHWSFDGLFGTFDRAALQRGYQVYSGVCAACHALSQIHYRNLQQIGLSEDEVKAVAAQAQILDGPDENGDMFERPGRPSDRLRAPFANEQAARAANNGAYPPDLSLIVEARAGGVDYLHALMTGYGEPPADLPLQGGMSYNAWFPGHQIAMPPPLSEGVVEYADGTPATVEQMAHDVATFLAWTTEPQLEERKRTGVKVILFLIVLTGLLYATKRKVWAAVH